MENKNKAVFHSRETALAARPPARRDRFASRDVIIILGAGFAGLRVALDLAKEIQHFPEYEIVLVNRNNIHLYTPDLYEIATAFYPKITEACLTDLKETVAIPLHQLILGKPIRFIPETVTEILPEEKKVILQSGTEIIYAFLVVALGSVTNYYNIPGLEQFSYPLKTITDGLAIQCHLDVFFHSLWKKGVKREVNLVIGGGGATGVEFTAELPSYVKKLCKKYNYPFASVHINIIEGKKEFLGLGQKASNIIEERLRKLGIVARLNTRIIEVAPGKISLRTAEGSMMPRFAERINPIETRPYSLRSCVFEIPSDFLVWTGGVTAHPLLREYFPKTTSTGALEVNEFLEVKNYSSVYAAGDAIVFPNPGTGKPLPWLAQLAVKEGVIVAKNILAEIGLGKKMRFIPQIRGMAITLGGKYALLRLDGLSGKIFSGFFPWISHRLVSLLYAMSIMPFFRAFRKWWHATNIFAQND